MPGERGDELLPDDHGESHAGTELQLDASLVVHCSHADTPSRISLITRAPGREAIAFT